MLINADVGECGLEVDRQIITKIDLANIACGGHIGDIKSITQTVKLAAANKTLIGAHISYPDKLNFGRVSQDIPLIKLQIELQKQIHLLECICKKHNTLIIYIKPHGALYHDACNNINIFGLILSLAKNFKFLIVQQDILSSKMLKLAKEKQVLLKFEVFADRGYTGKQLIPRGKTGAVFTTINEIQMQYQKFKLSANYQKNNNKIDTICFHSDNQLSVLFLKNL